MSALGALVGRELSMLRRNWILALVYVALPLLIAAFTREVFGAVAVATGMPGNGAEQAIAGQSTMFGVMLLSQLGYSFFEERAWGTWDRLRASPVPMASVVAAKLGVNWAHQMAQCLLLVAAGVTVFDLRIDGSIPAVLILAAAYAAALTALGFLLVAVVTSNAQFNVGCYLGALVLAGCGGALVPYALLPDWARAIGPATPSYWAMEGLTEAFAVGGSVGRVGWRAAVLGGVAVGALALGAVVFRPERRARSYA